MTIASPPFMDTLSSPPLPGAIHAAGPCTTPSRRVRMFDIAVDALTMEESLDRAEALLEAERPVHHVCLNAAKVVRLADDPQMRQIFDDAGMVHVDGVPVRWAGRFLGAEVPERVAGIDFMEAMLDRAADRGWRVYFLGATEEVVQTAVAVELERHPGLHVVGVRNGYWTPEEEASVVAEVAAQRPDLLLLALPTPRKENFAHDHLDELNARFILGVGGSFDVAAGVTRRAPVWMQRIGMEWGFRLIQEPRRMWKRYLTGNSRFLLLVVHERRRNRRVDTAIAGVGSVELSSS
jgi:N-acetylglucosaminyldiphosphoundecaprenol N-acetyl-beta-D-mannosaminyltransferase